MGANAQTAVPVFTAGQVLTAVQQTQINTGIPVFATTVTRDAAFGGAGEKTLAEGQFAYIEATDTTQYYDGAAWQSVGASSGLTFIGRTTVAGSSTVNINNVFSSTYTNYQIVTNLTTSAITTIQMRLRVSGADNTTSNYNIAYAYQQIVTAQSTGFVVSQGQSLFNLQGINGLAANINMTIFNPQATASTTMAFNSNHADSTAQGWYVFNGGAAFTASTSFDGFSLLTGGAPTFTGTIDIYGLAKV